VIRAIKGYLAAGGKMDDVEKLALAAMGRDMGFDLDPLGYMAGVAETLDEEIELTSELLNQILVLVHPDLHPPERQQIAHRVTSQLLALKPFVFPALKPKEPAQPTQQAPSQQASPRPASSSAKPVATYPCADCADAMHWEYCDACRAEYERRRRQKYEKQAAKESAWQRASYARRRERTLARRPPKHCASCGKEFKAKRNDAQFCSSRCRQRARRQAPITDKSHLQNNMLFIRDAKRLIWLRSIAIRRCFSTIFCRHREPRLNTKRSARPRACSQRQVRSRFGPTGLDTVGLGFWL
jgi:hypothetical protein